MKARRIFLSAKAASNKQSASKAGSGRGAKAKITREPSQDALLSPAMRDDLIGLGLVILGIAMFIMVVMPGTAIVSRAVEGALRAGFGLGAFVLPFAFIAWGLTFFLKPQNTGIARMVVGITVIFLALTGLFATVCIQGSYPSLDGDFFAQSVLRDGGGFVGSAIAFALIKTVGNIIAYIVLLALIVVGMVLVGFSISMFFSFAKNLAHERAIDRKAKAEQNGSRRSRGKLKAGGDEDDFEPVVRKGAAGSQDLVEFDPEDMPRADETVMLGNRRGRKKPALRFESGTLDLDDTGSDESFDFVDDPSAAQTQILPTATKRKGAKTTKLGKKSKESAVAEPSAAVADSSANETVKLDKKPAPEGAAPAATEGFELPKPEVLKVSGHRDTTAMNSEFKSTAILLQRTLEEFNLHARVVGWLAGPTVTLFKVELPSGVKLSKLTGLADDIALALAASSVRIAQIPNTSLVGVEIPNKQRQNVLLGDIIGACGKSPLDMAIGEDIDGNKVCKNLAKMPHLLIGGTTGSGKSVCINSMIMSIIMRATPAEVRMILIDPKRIEFSQYNGIPHLYVPVVTEPKEAASALRWGVVEMERRLKVFEGVGARNIGFYNQKIQNGELDNEEGERPKEMPYIVIVIDELSDLMMAAGKDVEDSIVRISQLARAAGIHLIVATQRPSSNVVTGMIKANITNRIALLVATGIDSRVILDTSGAEKLVGNGDMLFGSPEFGKPKRIQGCYVSDEEINEVVAHLKEQGSPEYHPEILQVKTEGSSSKGGGGFDDAGEDDPLLWEAADAVVHAGLGSTSMLQRRLKVGYARAGRIMDMLENKGIVGPADGSRAREVLIDSVEDLEAIKAFEMSDGEGF